MKYDPKNPIITGAKKAGKCLSILALTTSLALGMATTAAAEVRPENVIGDEFIQMDRSGYKREDAIAIEQYFKGTDQYGYPNLYPYQIRQAIEMSNALNAYNGYDNYNHSNTTRREVLGLDIDNMYAHYLADLGNGAQNFCAANIENKSALDAYLNFSCGTIADSIRDVVADSVYVSLYNQGIQLATRPKIRVINDTLYAFAEFNGSVSMIEIDTDEISDIKWLCNELDNRYMTCFNSVSGAPEYVNSFAYNGTDRLTNECAWLSLGDDDMKQLLTESMDRRETLSDDLIVSVNLPEGLFVYDENDIKILRSMGYRNELVQNAMKYRAKAEINQDVLKLN